MLKSLTLALIATSLSACDIPLAWGEQNSIIVATSADNWAEIEGTIDEALETQVLTVRPEKTFNVSFGDPALESWRRLRLFRQVLVVGTVDDPWVAEALAESNEEDFSPPQILQVNNVWARGQTVTVMLTRPGSLVEDVTARAEELHSTFDDRYRRWVLNRMFMSGRDSTLADTLWTQSRFALLLPAVYYRRQDADSVFIFRNDNPDPSELIRQVTVSWRSPIPRQVARDDVLLWRQELSDNYFSRPQAIDTTYSRSRRLQIGDMLLNEYQATWTNPPADQFPAAGPFVMRWVECPTQNRLYLVDAWLYAPAKDKYQYLLQLETILDSFRCAQGGGTAAVR